MSGEETLLKRWSRLKRGSRDEAKPKPEQAEADAKPQQQTKVTPVDAVAPAPADPDKGDPKVIAELPPVESLGKDSDYSPFMRQGVPQALRLAALRKLWTSDPALAVPDPLDIHNLDYTHLAAPGQVVTTAYKVGKGFADEVDKSIERVERKRGEAAPSASGEARAEPAKENQPTQASESAAPEREPPDNPPKTPKRPS
ncbi:MAG: DUF3306 domain-containing protein [Rhodospirillales bacterium]